MNASLIASLSVLLTAAVVGNAFYQKKQFYPSVVYLTKSNASLAVIYVQAFVLVILFGKLVRKIFFGQLRAAEFEHLMERSWYAVTETCLAFTMFRDDLSPKFVALFTLLLFLKSFHWLAEDRVDYMERSPVITWVFHIRIISLLVLLSLLDVAFIAYAYHSTVTRGASVQLVFGFEYAILLTAVAYVLVKYVLHTVDLQREAPWENKAVHLLHTELLIGFVKVILYMVFTLIMVKIHTLPLFAIRPMYLALRSFKKALSDVILSRRAIHNMNTLYPNVTEEELQNTDSVCIICREEMTAAAGAKKLPCNHVFHALCLRSWFQRQQTCPTCRMDILRAPAPAAPPPPPPQPQPQQPPAPGQPPQNAGAPPFLWPFPPPGVVPPAGAGMPPPPPPAAAGQPADLTVSPAGGAAAAGSPQPPPPPPFGHLPAFPFAQFMMMPPMPPPPADLSGLSEQELRLLESQERAGLEARVRALRDIRTLLDAAVVMMEQYSRAAAVAGVAPTAAPPPAAAAAPAAPAASTGAPSASTATEGAAAAAAASPAAEGGAAAAAPPSYNVTILAYGQTGSGKTYTMGTVYSSETGMTDETGVIPRAMTDLFAQISERSDCEFVVRVSFLEIYKEQLFDLPSFSAQIYKEQLFDLLPFSAQIYKEQLFDLLSGKERDQSQVDIREDTKGIRVAGLTEVAVTTVTETISCLERGGLGRITGATAMNLRSSRSHAIFTVCLEQRARDTGATTTAKLHLVDLAGSERAKKTQATGDRLKEGININRGLLSLGNVISALGEDKPPKHVPYRDSKLTRMLQESLGGNSHTLMIACTSPADANLEETVSTLRYADRARKIKNKPIVNREGNEIARLRQQVQQLQAQLLEVQGGCPAPAAPVTGGVPAVPPSPGGPSALVAQNRRLMEENRRLARDLQASIEEHTALAEKALLAERAADRFKQRLEELYQQTGDAMRLMNQSGAVGADELSHVRDLQSRIMDMQHEQTHHEEELRRLDATRHVTSSGGPAEDGESSSSGGAGEDEDEEVDEDEFVKKHALRQAELNNELLDLNRALALKENLASEMANSNTQMLVVRQRYEQTTRELEEQVLTLSAEKERLEQALQGARQEAAGSKAAEQKRQRVKELEERIKSLMHKMKEQERLLRMKRAADEKVVQLNKEIQNIKHTRVKLIRQMKEDGDKFRQWRQKKDREVMQLKAQDRKRQVQLVKLERQHVKQETVLRRKMENAMAANRRLKEVLEQRQSARERRQPATGGGGSGGAAAAVTAQVDQELELLVSARLAQRSLQQLIDDRRRLNAQLKETEKKLQRDDVSAEEVAQLTRTKRDIQNELVSRNGQIADLQHRLMNVESDGRAAAPAQRWATVTSMADAKKALEHLFELAAGARTDASARQSDGQELQSQLDEALQAVEELEREAARERRQFEERLSRLTLENEEKVLMLLRHMPQPQGCSTPNSSFKQGSGGDDGATAALQERLAMQEREILRLSELHDMLSERDAEVAALRAEAEKLKTQLSEAQTAPAKRARSAKPPPRLQQRVQLDEILSQSESESGDDDSQDPEWVRTPLFKRISRMTSRASQMARRGPDNDSNSESPADSDGAGTVKRRSDGTPRCNCKGMCKLRCPCRSHRSQCDENCQCKPARRTQIFEPPPSLDSPEMFEAPGKKVRAMSIFQEE
ncbi:Chromosome-associated kinesin KIF4A [Amphibalanus amphitrite]|uniref:RING-type E3 ubiquitin transferase n=1 Tax=Amphibalanus amphitrite TaxID=1232801 RepID=A0A6A4W0K9_AMPAM|nr:Chromosome-associated kinesin KIF4A [Amphibalanus amphitrite]